MDETDRRPRKGSLSAWPALRKAYLIAGILLLAVAITQSIRLPFASWAYHLINLLPAVLLLLGQHFCFRHRNAKWSHGIIIGAGTLTLGLAVLVNVGLELFVREVSPVTDIRKYGEILGKWEHSEVQHFPGTIPLEAEEAKFYYRPAFLQGGAAVQLRLKLPAPRVQMLYTKYSAQARFSFNGGDSNIHSNLPDGVPTTFFYTSGTSDDTFPNSCVILVLGPYTLDEVREMHEKNESFNHSQSCGVACDRAHSEVVYWAEHW